MHQPLSSLVANGQIDSAGAGYLEARGQQANMREATPTQSNSWKKRSSMYLSTRLPTLMPTFDVTSNPLSLLGSLSAWEWNNFLLGFCAWALDALDYHTVTQTYTQLMQSFGRSTADISVAVTLSLALRPLGAAIFGIASDTWGRKWPLVCNLAILIVFELSTGFCATYNQFLAVRALFGIAMGGVYGNAAATALEDCPAAARGLMSGFYQSGYPFGYLLAVVFWKAFIGETNNEWRSLFFFSATLPLLIIIWRVFAPETKAYTQRKYHRGENPTVRDISDEAKTAVKKYWLLLLYLILLVTGLSYMSHGSQDLYAVMLQYKYDFQSNDVTLVQVVANLGAVLGGVSAGYCSQIVGRRFSIVVLCFVSGALLYPYTFISGPGIYAAAFFEQFCVQGALGVIPIHLLELSPVAFRTFVVGTSYQLGILIACASNTILTTIGERYPLPPNIQDGQITPIYDYGVVICIFTACAISFTIIATVLGPEKRGRSLAMQAVEEIPGRIKYELNIQDNRETV